ncbi:MAG: CidA/LrgA family protein [Candidatus Thiodiazotropha sp.]
MGFINGITLFLIYQLIGEVCVRLLGLPVPGPVLGMLLLFATLLVRGRSHQTLDDSASTLLSHLSLLFVPAGVGMIVHLDLIAEAWLPIVLTLVLSTLITMAATAGVMWLAVRLFARRP